MDEPFVSQNRVVPVPRPREPALEVGFGRDDTSANPRDEEVGEAPFLRGLGIRLVPALEYARVPVAARRLTSGNAKSGGVEERSCRSSIATGIALIPQSFYSRIPFDTLEAAFRVATRNDFIFAGAARMILGSSTIHSKSLIHSRGGVSCSVCVTTVTSLSRSAWH